MTYLLTALGVIWRLLPHWPNFVPIGAIGIFSSNKQGIIKASLTLILIMVLSDIFLGFSFVSIFVYVGMLTYIFWGRLTKKGWWGIAAPIGGSMSFFIISNLGVWLSPWYTHDLSGLIKCFTLAIPFYKFTLLSDIIFTAVLFGTSILVEKFKKGELKWHIKLPKVSLSKKS